MRQDAWHMLCVALGCNGSSSNSIVFWDSVGIQVASDTCTPVRQAGHFLQDGESFIRDKWCHT